MLLIFRSSRSLRSRYSESCSRVSDMLPDSSAARTRETKSGLNTVRVPSEGPGERGPLVHVAHDLRDGLADDRVVEVLRDRLHGVAQGHAGPRWRSRAAGRTPPSPRSGPRREGRRRPGPRRRLRRRRRPAAAHAPGADPSRSARGSAGRPGHRSGSRPAPPPGRRCPRCSWLRN